MITDNNKALTQWAMDFALKNGAQSAKLVLYNNSSSSFELRNAKMDRLQQSTENGLSISLYVDGRYGSFSTNRLDKKELETLILNGIESTRYLAPDELMPRYRTLVKLGAAYLDIRRQETLGTLRKTDENEPVYKYIGSMKQIKQHAPRTLYAIQTMPAVRDTLQTTLLRRENKN